MGPQLMAGLSCLGAAIAIGLIAPVSRPPRDTEPSGPGSSRQLAMLLMTFCAGIASMGFLIAVLAIASGPVVRQSSDGLLAALPALAGVIVGIGLLTREREVADPRVTRAATIFLIGTAVVGMIIAAARYSLVGQGSAPPPDWPFPMLGLVTCAAALAMGSRGARALIEMRDAGKDVAEQIYARQLSRTALFEGVAVAASAIAILLVVSA